MAERVEYVHVHFHQAVTSPRSARPSKSDASVFLDAFLDDGSKRKRELKLEREGDVIIATHVETGRVREYPWSAARQATRADVRYVDDDPRTGKLKPAPEPQPAQKGKAP
jgi:hypothetical protein